VMNPEVLLVLEEMNLEALLNPEVMNLGFL
jgi:hypothetical protein